MHRLSLARLSKEGGENLEKRLLAIQDAATPRSPLSLPVPVDPEGSRSCMLVDEVTKGKRAGIHPYTDSGGDHTTHEVREQAIEHDDEWVPPTLFSFGKTSLLAGGTSSDSR